MKKISSVVIALLLCFYLVGIMPNAVAQEGTVPDWIRQLSKFFSDGEISDQEYLDAIEYLLKQKIITSPKITVQDEAGIQTAQPTDGTFYRIGIDTEDTRVGTVGVHGSCPTTIPTKECLFSVDAIRVVPELRKVGQGTLDFDSLCVDNLSSNFGNCMKLTRGEVGISSGKAFELGAGPCGEAGLLAAGGTCFSWAIGAGGDLGFKLADLRLKVRQGTEMGAIIGGDILTHSGIGSVMSKKFVMFSSENFKGKIEFLGSKPEGMTLNIGYAHPTDQNSGKPVCKKIQAPDKIDDNNKVECDSKFAEALDMMFDHALQTESIDYYPIVLASTDGASITPTQSGSVSSNAPEITLDPKLVEQSIRYASKDLKKSTEIIVKKELEIILNESLEQVDLDGISQDLDRELMKRSDEIPRTFERIVSSIDAPDLGGIFQEVPQAVEDVKIVEQEVNKFVGTVDEVTGKIDTLTRNFSELETLWNNFVGKIQFG